MRNMDKAGVRSRLVAFINVLREAIQGNPRVSVNSLARAMQVSPTVMNELRCLKLLGETANGWTFYTEKTPEEMADEIIRNRIAATSEAVAASGIPPTPEHARLAAQLDALTVRIDKRNQDLADNIESLRKRLEYHCETTALLAKRLSEHEELMSMEMNDTATDRKRLAALEANFMAVLSAASQDKGPTNSKPVAKPPKKFVAIVIGPHPRDWSHIENRLPAGCSLEKFDKEREATLPKFNPDVCVITTEATQWQAAARKVYGPGKVVIAAGRIAGVVKALTEYAAKINA